VGEEYFWMGNIIGNKNKNKETIMGFLSPGPVQS